MLKSIFSILLIFCSSLVYGQTSQDNTTNSASNHSHQDSSYHCRACKDPLFEASDVTIINKKELHYHGVATDSTKTAFHCAGCKSHLGYYNHKDSNYQVLNHSISEKNTSNYHCSSCQMPLFNKQDQSNSNDTYAYFSKPIDKERIALEERNKFYKIQNSHATCRKCNARIGEVNKNDSGGFGMRLNIGTLKKKRN